MVRLVSKAAILGLMMLCLPGEAVAKKCKKKGNKPQVFIKPNTPLRRGPGLNYQVATFLERSRCAPFTEISMDRTWVLVDTGTRLGWVERDQLSSDSQEMIAKAGTGDAPIGSGQKRNYAEAKGQITLMEAPSVKAQPKSILPEGSRLLPLAQTTDGTWIQVRDERSELGWVMKKQIEGKGFDDLPKTDAGVELVEDEPDPDPPVIVEKPILPPGGGGGESGINVFAAVMGAALAPIHKLDSNSQSPYRKYELSSISGGAGLEIGLTELGPISVRLGYQFAMISGVTADENKSKELTGMQHDGQVRIGLPLAVGPVLLTPEIGYEFGMFDFDSALAIGAANTTAQFVSSVTNAGLAGLKLEVFATPSVLIGIEGAFLAGITAESPQELGDAGLTLGTIAGIGGQFLVTDLVSVVARYHVAYRTTSFTGNGLDDISEATLSDLSHGLMVGVAFTVGG